MSPRAWVWGIALSIPAWAIIIGLGTFIHSMY